MNSSNVWIYHERQDAALCGQHALNNLVQACIFSAGSLAEIAHQLDKMELTYMAQNNEGGLQSKDYLQRLAEGSGNVDEQGNFSIQVLDAALQNSVYNLKLINLNQAGVTEGLRDITDIDGFLCNKQSHWFAIRKINGRYWNLNSTLERPELISHFHVAITIESLIQNEGYSVFVCCNNSGSNNDDPSSSSTKLPDYASYQQQQDYHENEQFWWKEQDLLKGGGGTSSFSGAESAASATTTPSDPWKNAGSGNRLDGKPASSSSSDSPIVIGDDLTEEEMLQMAMAASLQDQQQQQQISSQDDNTEAVVLSPEPDAKAEGAIRIQFRFMSGRSNRKTAIRRFLKTDSIQMVKAYVKSEEDHPNVTLRYGYPPKDLNDLLRTNATLTIEEAKLAGESIQVVIQ